MKTTHVTIVGSGLAGNFLAILLARKGYHIDIYERLTRDEAIANFSKRSYSLTFYSYLTSVLKKTELWDALEPYILPVRGSVTFINADPSPAVTRFTESDPSYFAVKRSDFLSVLLAESSRYPSIAHHYGTRLVGLDRNKHRMYLIGDRSGSIGEKSYETLIGADGVHSLVRAFVQRGQSCEHSLMQSDWEYKQIAIPLAESAILGLEKGYVFSWTGSNAVLTALPNRDGSYGALLFLPKTGLITFSDLTASSAISKIIHEYLPFLTPVQSLITKCLLENPTGTLHTLRTSPWNYEGTIGLIGDAAHSVYPFLGQGVSAAFADCMAISDLLENGCSLPESISRLESVRKPNSDVITDLSSRAFSEYRRNKRADYDSVYNKAESVLSALLPSIILPPLYLSIMKYPAYAAYHQKRHTRQRIAARFLGIPVLIALLTFLLALAGGFKKLSLRFR